jgi:PIN domain nuclease of toxin-antitoxin system
MAILLDTHVIIWIDENSARLTKAIDKYIDEDDVFISKASVWELAIKARIGKISFTDSLETVITNFLHDYKVRMLDISLPHNYQTQLLPLHHRDPFDRLLIAQALSENIAIVSSDAIFGSYGVKRIW